MSTPATTKPSRDINYGIILELVMVLVVLGMLLSVFMTSLHAARESQARADQQRAKIQYQTEVAAAEVLGNPTPEPPAGLDDTHESSRDGALTPDIPWTPVLNTLGGLGLLAAAGAGGTALHRRHVARTTAQQAMAKRWDEATVIHDTIADEYADLRLDADAALHHEALWNINDRHTETFALAYAAAADTRSLHANKTPTNAHTVDTYVTQVKEAHRAWVNARDNTSQTPTLAAHPPHPNGILSVARSILRPQRHRTAA